MVQAIDGAEDGDEGSAEGCIDCDGELEAASVGDVLGTIEGTGTDTVILTNCSENQKSEKSEFYNNLTTFIHSNTMSPP